MRVLILQSASDQLCQSERLALLEETAHHHQGDVLICPELFMSGYNVGDDLLKYAESLDGPFAAQVSKIAQSANLHIVYGYPEKHADGLFNSAQCINPQGMCIANHRKLAIPPGFERNYFSPGSDYTAFEINGYRCGILICYDAEFPETVRHMASEGVELAIVPTALVDQWHSVAHQLMPTRAFENGIWLAYVNHAGYGGELTYLGASCMVAPNGSDAARAGAEQTVIGATIDRGSVTKAQARLPYLLDYKALAPERSQ